MVSESHARPVLVLTGTTASGKNQVASLVVRALNAEIISLDSMKVYRGMDIGTDKPSKSLRAEIPHHLVDTLNETLDMAHLRAVEPDQLRTTGLAHLLPAVLPAVSADDVTVSTPLRGTGVAAEPYIPRPEE